MAMKELQKSLKRSKTQVKSIEAHIKEGTTILEKKQKSLVELDPKVENEKKVDSNDFEMDLGQKSAVKKEATAAKKEVAADKKAEKKESDKKDDVKKD